MQQSSSTRAAIFPGIGRLRFADDLEPSFAEYHTEHSLPLARFALVLALLLYALSGVLDLYVAPGVAQWIWLIRYAVFCPTALIALVLTFTRCFRPVMQPVLSAVAVVAGLGIVAMIAIASPAVAHLYYAGLLLVVRRVWLDDRFTVEVPAFAALRGAQQPGPFGARRAHRGQGVPAGDQHLLDVAGVYVGAAQLDRPQAGAVLGSQILDHSAGKRQRHPLGPRRPSRGHQAPSQSVPSVSNGPA